MMNLVPSSIDYQAAIDFAARQLVSVKNWGADWFVNLPMFYPSGAQVTVKIAVEGSTFNVSDYGSAYREVELIGAERSYPKTATRVAGEEGVNSNRRIIFASASPDHLVVKIAKVAMASWRAAQHISEKATSREEAEIADHLHDRLVAIFGPRVRPDGVHLVGLSKSEWEVSALVEMDDQLVVFDAVAKHRNSIYRTSTKFHDLAALDNPPRLVAVVKSKEALGHGLPLLSQAGRVIEEAETDAVFVRAAA